ncbi:nitrate reductase molybdenum cofactor assembly chaperone [Occultella gossypii]|uniref:Nitrate reductase molybdenum cofactor assembly chaperone n=1 Tax=Occultella gossypii TaxID=2800820 RepID=A0ABS7S5T5_9MICO|nr:nitrate reductase molybdenum cofactor assembly chaperone [Occultella gossypii]MBZ2195708.1 nitrate reductase molybdenum cofactor assembly chaperone [Occultella gossypii]
MKQLLTLRRDRPRAGEGTNALIYRVAAFLLEYPDANLTDRLPALAAAVATLPEPARSDLGGLVDHLSQAPGGDEQAIGAEYVRTFDLDRRRALYLTYYAFGDTRKRGMAMLDFKSAYRQSGLELSDDELPDHLCVVLEFAATTDLAWGRELLLKHRAGLEVLRVALRDAGSPYAGALTAVCGTLPPLAGEEEKAIATLIAAGPPEEEVGLEPFAPPSYMGESR